MGNIHAKCAGNVLSEVLERYEGQTHFVFFVNFGGH